MKKIILSFVCIFIFVFCLGIAMADTSEPILVEKITLIQESTVLSVGKTFSIKATVEPKKVKNGNLEWISSDESIATVSKGKVKGVAPGKATILVNSTDGSKVSANFEVTVVKPINKITVADAKLILAPETKWKQTITILPEDASMKELAWSSSNEKTATVDSDGVITAVAVGKCTITGNAQDDSKKKVSVSVQVLEHDVLILEPGEIDVAFETRDASRDHFDGKEPFVISNGEKVIITDEVFENGHHFTSPDGRSLVSIPDDNDNYKYFEKDEATGRIFETNSRSLSFVVNGKPVKKDTEETTVKFRNGLVSEGSERYKLKPLKPGSETVEIVTKLNGKKVLSQYKYLVFVSQDAVP